MKFADEIMNNKKARLEQKSKEHNELVNAELLEIEKAINTYESDLEDTKPYIDIQMIIKTDEAKESLKEHRFFIDKVSQYIPYGITRVYLDKTSYDKGTFKRIHSLEEKYYSNIDPLGYKKIERENKERNKQESVDSNKSYEELTSSCLKDRYTNKELFENEYNVKDFINFIESLTKR